MSGQELVVPETAVSWETKIDLVRRTVCKGASNDEMELFFYQARRTGLDPLARQIHFVKRGDQGSIQTGIDGYRLIADRTGCYAGNDEPVFSGQVKAESSDSYYPDKATVTVWKLIDGSRYPFTAAARWKEYYPGGQVGFMWRKMPHTMLGKVAEALALRKAFPAELSGVYTNEEMAQAGNTGIPPSDNGQGVEQPIKPAPRPEPPKRQRSEPAGTEPNVANKPYQMPKNPPTEPEWNEWQGVWHVLQQLGVTDFRGPAQDITGPALVKLTEAAQKRIQNWHNDVAPAGGEQEQMI